MRNLRQLFAIPVAVLLIAAPAASAPASAHVFLFKSTPGDGAVLPELPPRITAEFTSEVAATGSVIALFNSAGAEVDNLDTSLDPADARKMTVTLPPLPPGAYHATWTAVDALDGHANQGAFDITIGTAAPADPAPAPADSQPAANGPASADAQPAPNSVPVPDQLPIALPSGIIPGEPAQ